MTDLIVTRIEQDDCTVGVMNYGEFRCFTLELPWLSNAKYKSSIPVGTYRCTKWESPTFGNCLKIWNVHGRTDVLVHYGNYVSNTKGCILVGDSIRDINGDGIPDVTNSKKTVEKLLSVVPDEFTIVVR